MKLLYSVLGAGARGSVFGARLTLKGHPVELLNRTPDHSKAIKEQGGLICHLDQQKHRIPLQADLVARAKAVDVFLFSLRLIKLKKRRRICLQIFDLPISSHCKTGWVTGSKLLLILGSIKL